MLRSDALAYTLGTGAEGFIERANINRAAGDASLAGNSQANTLLGNSFDNRLEGGEGDDILNGRQGGDSLIGGAGDDTFVVDTATDRVEELDGEGSDLVRAESDFTLPDGSATAFVEALRMQGGKGDIDGTGNGLDNVIEGNSGANGLRGLAGADRIKGGAGDDRLFGGADGDLLEGGSGADTLLVESGDSAFGGSGADRFRFDGDPIGGAGSAGASIGDFDGVLANAANGADKLVFATGLESGGFGYIGSAAFSAGGSSEARFAGTERVEVDQNGDGAADQVFLLQGVTLATLLTASDFIWS